MAISAGYNKAAFYQDKEALLGDMESITSTDGPYLIELQIQPEPGPPRWAGIKMAEQVKSLKAELSDENE